MPELPPITRTVCPVSSGSRWVGEALVEVAMVPLRVEVATDQAAASRQVTGDPPARRMTASLTSDAPGWVRTLPWRFHGGVAPGRHPGRSLVCVYRRRRWQR